MDESQVKDVILEAMESGLEAQLRAIRRLRSGQETASGPKTRKGMSQVDMAFDILLKAKTPQHINEIIRRIAEVHGRQVDRESLASSLVKKVQRRDRFIRTDKNVFGLLKEAR
jgi:DNA-binding GntR family transcriptional regulator